MAQAHSHDHHDDAHSPQHYIKIWVVLLVLLFVSILGPEVAPMFGPTLQLWVVLITAFGIAFVKAWLVIKHFMHLTAEKPIVWYILITCLVFLVLFIAGTAPDVKNHEGTNWVNAAAKAEITRAQAAYAKKAEAEAEGEHSKEKILHRDPNVSFSWPEVSPGEPSGHLAPTAEESDAPSAEAPTPAEAPTGLAAVQGDAARKAWLMKRGEAVYAEAACVTCHRANGAGHGPYPTLIGQQEHMGDCAKTLGIIKNGMSEPITIGETTYDMPMPPTPGLSAEDAAAVATYIRNAWGNDYGVCEP